MQFYTFLVIYLIGLLKLPILLNTLYISQRSAFWFFWTIFHSKTFLRKFGIRILYLLMLLLRIVQRNSVWRQDDAILHRRNSCLERRKRACYDDIKDFWHSFVKAVCSKIDWFMSLFILKVDFIREIDRKLTSWTLNTLVNVKRKGMKLKMRTRKGKL